MRNSSWARVLKYFNEKNTGDIISRKEGVKEAKVEAGTFDAYRKMLEDHLFILKDKRGTYKVIRKVPVYTTQGTFVSLPRNNLAWIEYNYEQGKIKNEN